MNRNSMVVIQEVTVKILSAKFRSFVFGSQYVDRLRPSDVRHVQATVSWLLYLPSHYMNQVWVIDN